VRNYKIIPPQRTTFDYGDLEKTGKAVFKLMVDHLDVDDLRYEPGYNMSRILREAVESVAGY